MKPHDSRWLQIEKVLQASQIDSASDGLRSSPPLSPAPQGAVGPFLRRERVDLLRRPVLLETESSWGIFGDPRAVDVVRMWCNRPFQR